MAVDRAAMTSNIFDSLARQAIGPTVSYFVFPEAPLKQVPYDPVSAARILDSLGWKMNDRTGVRARNGRELRFRILFPTSSTNRQKMSVLIQEQLRKAGVAADLDPMEAGTFNSRVAERDFDAVLWGWHLGTDPSAIGQSWTTSAIKGGNNFGSYASSAFDAHLDSAKSTFDLAESKAQYLRAYQQAIDDAPAIWLYEPRLALGIQKRIRTEPYRPDAWWYSLADWHIPADEQIPRDRVK
jgi:peptide/nickel transport system substrate-binding protein